MKSMKRALRRHHIYRLKRKRKNYWGHRGADELDKRQLGIAIQTPTPCSCWMCGNQRRHFGMRTRQELRNNIENMDFELEM